MVEEEGFEFSFSDRFQLVKEGIWDIKNVTVLRSGRLIISTLTFPGYFTKDSKEEVTIDSVIDVEIFGEYIVPLLDISVRFVGNEPLCGITRQYNETMKDVLPEFQVEYVEIKRKEKNGYAISASRVRELYKKNEMEEVKGLVPASTYSFLSRLR